MSSLGERKIRTLVVEDNVSYREMIRDSLNTLFPSMVIQEALDGNEAIQKVDVFLPQLILMDVRLPGENGLRLTERIKASHPDAKVIIMTSYDSLEYREAAARCGADGYIAKDSLTPGEIEKLVQSLAE